MKNDVSRAYFYAPIQPGQLTHVKLPPENTLHGEEEMCGLLNYSMYGTRRAATNWQQHFTSVLLKAGYEQWKTNPCTFYHPSRQIYTIVHGDDFLSTGAGPDLE